MEHLLKSKDEELSKLLTENRNLLEELQKCQADKEFVWSLWKRLQVSSPDLTQAITLVLQREKEKAEAKDRKVLDILQTKDEQINGLQTTVASLQSKNEDLMRMKVDAEGNNNTHAAECRTLKNQIASLTQQLKLQQQETRDKLEELQHKLEDADQQKASLMAKNTNLNEKLASAQVQGDMAHRCKTLEASISTKEQTIKNMTAEKEELYKEVELYRLKYEAVKDGLTAEEQSLQEKNLLELTEAYEQLKQHSKQQKELIAQLQELNTNTQKLISDQEATHRNENKSLQSVNKKLQKENKNLNKESTSYKQEIEELQERVLSQEEALRKAEREIKKSIAMASTGAYDYVDLNKVDNLEDQIRAQRKEIEHLSRRLNNRLKSNRSPSPSYEHGDQTFSPIVERRTNAKSRTRCRSLSPCGQNRQLSLLHKKLKATETKLDQTNHMLELKKEEVREIQQAHNKRLNRLNLLQADYKALKSGLNETSSPKRRKHRPPPTMDPRKLRHENSDSVWNDLAYYKQENKALLQDKLSMEEELDNLRVQYTMDRAAFQDENLCLRQERDDLAFKLRSTSRKNATDRLSSTPKKSSHSPSREDVKSSRRMVKNLEKRLENFTEDNHILKREREKMLQDNRALKEELKSVKCNVIESRQSGTKLRHENGDLRHKLEEMDHIRIKMEKDVDDLNREIGRLRSENEVVVNENSSLWSENSELRETVNNMRIEFEEVQKEIQEIEPEIPNSHHVPMPSSHAKHEKVDATTSPMAKHHRDVLNRSINEMRRMLGEDFHHDSFTEPTSGASTDDEEERRSITNSLGRSIVRASRRNDGKENEHGDKNRAAASGKKHDVKPIKKSTTTYRAGQGMLDKLRQKLSTVQTQCSSLRSEKQAVLQKFHDEKERCEKVEADLDVCQSKLKSAKQSIQRLTNDVRKLERTRDELEEALSESKKTEPKPQVHTDSEYRVLENKLKNANQEVSRLNENIKDQKKVIEFNTDQSNAEKDKFTRLERDITMKRQLIDELRGKIKNYEQKNKREFTELHDAEEKLKHTEEDLAHKKTHIESLRRQVQVATKEKAKYEAMYHKSREELDKRSEQLSALQSSKLAAESMSSRIEEEAGQQLQKLADRSEQAIEKLRLKLEKSEEKLMEFSTFVKNLSGHLMELQVKQRGSLYREKATQAAEAQTRNGYPSPEKSSMSHAQSVACNILNMSRSDFEDLMTPVDSSSRHHDDQEAWNEEKILSAKTDQIWRSKVEKISGENPPFAKSLCRLLWDKIQDAVKLTEDRCRLQVEYIEQKVSKQ
uniref:centlein n=1 Tax=Ciona intestinalis TaxID=7719 RepID=UPI0002B8D77D|nr:centlein [Ciona intestinalis]|eukprot:XP_002122336.2 centlein [Ciona intestinalis]